MGGVTLFNMIIEFKDVLRIKVRKSSRSVVAVYIMIIVKSTVGPEKTYIICMLGPFYMTFWRIALLYVNRRITSWHKRYRVNIS